MCKDKKHLIEGNLSRPYINLKVYGQTVLLDGGHGRIGGAWPDWAPGSATGLSGKQIQEYKKRQNAVISG